MKNNVNGIKKVECENCAMNRLCLPTLIGDRKFNFTQDLLNCRNYAVKQGSFLFKQGDEFNSIYAICSGGIKLATKSTHKTEQVAGFYYPGEIVGASAINTKRYQTDAIVLGGTKICKMPFNQLELISHSIPEIMTEIFKLMSNELSLHQEILKTLSGNKTAEEKLAAFFINTSQRYAQHGFSEKIFKLVMTRLDIGNHLGLAKATVSRMMQRFINKGFVEITGRNCHLLDLQQLRNIVAD